MAREFVEVRSSDLSGEQSDDVVGVGFSLDGKSYEIDLTPQEEEELKAALKPYVAKARKASGSEGRSARTRSGSNAAKRREELQAARTWLRLRGHEVPKRGRVKSELLEEWEKAGRPGL